jgi:hypothetical protein
VRGKRVLVVDDILTSGATMTEAARHLYAAGATSVMACPIAINQSEINCDPNYELQCPRKDCSGNMRVRFAAKTEGAFWGCDQWRSDGTGCAQMMTFAEGMTAANRLTDRDSIMVFGNVPF